MSADSKDEDGVGDVPRSLVKAYNSECGGGTYGGSLSEYVAVNYLIFRTRWAATSAREAPSKSRWLENLRDFEKDCG